MQAFRNVLVIAAIAAAIVLFITHQSHPQAASSSASFSTTNQSDTNDQSESSADDTGSSNAGTFHGYACTVDCSGHEAGYNWAEEHDITDRDECPVDPHNSQSFTEGCWAYADEHSDGGDDSQ